MSSLIASFEATRQARLPAAAQIKLCVRDLLIVDWFISPKPPRVQRMAVIYDFDRDERILDFLSVLHFKHPNIRANVIGVAESKGAITVWYGDKLSLDSCGRALNEAAYAATWPTDKWRVGWAVLVPVRDGQLDRDRLDPSSPLRATPERFQLGLIEVQS